MANQLVPFGKYKGQPLEVLLADTQYMTWLSEQPWVKERYPVVQTLIVNNFGEPDETPEHNSFQAHFYDNQYANAYITHLISDEILEAFESLDKRIGALNNVITLINRKLDDGHEKVWDHDDPGFVGRIKKTTNQWIGDTWHDIILSETRDSILEEIAKKRETLDDLSELFSEDNSSCFACDVESEVNGWDIHVSLCYPLYGLTGQNNFFVELKPDIGNDFPAVLRQMKNNRERNRKYYPYADYCLVYRNYHGVGANEDIMRKQFETSDFYITREDEFWPAFSLQKLLHGRGE